MSAAPAETKRSAPWWARVGAQEAERLRKVREHRAQACKNESAVERRAVQLPEAGNRSAR